MISLARRFHWKSVCFFLRNLDKSRKTCYTNTCCKFNICRCIEVVVTRTTRNRFVQRWARGFESHHLRQRLRAAAERALTLVGVRFLFVPRWYKIFFIASHGQNLKRNVFQVLFFYPAPETRGLWDFFGRLQTARIFDLQPLDSYPFQVRMPYKIFGKMSENARSGQKMGKNARSDWEFYHCFRGSPSGRIRVFAMVSALSCLDWESKWA